MTHDWTEFDGSCHCYWCGLTVHGDGVRGMTLPVDGCIDLPARVGKVLNRPEQWSRRAITQLLRDVFDSKQPTYRLLRAGRYRFGDEVVDVTPDVLRQMADTPVPAPVNVRHDATKVAGSVRRFVISDDGQELLAELDSLKLVPAFSVDPPGIAEISVTGHEMIAPETLDESRGDGVRGRGESRLDGFGPAD
jgi:hypothetical protein